MPPSGSNPWKARLAAVMDDAVRVARRVVHRFRQATDQRWCDSLRPPWRRDTQARRRSPVWCNICGWCGDGFLGTAHSESAACPRCGSIARDRYLFWCFVSRCPRRPGLRVLETSPRLGYEYRRMMRHWYAYRCSDFDMNSHTADITLDLQNIDLPDACVDVLITPHVLEHVPDTEKALGEAHRLLSRRGRMYLQVPLLQGATAPPVVTEYHADNTLVHWRFGWDLTDIIRRAGFDVRVLLPVAFKTMLDRGAVGPGESGGEFDLASIHAAARRADLEPVLAEPDARRLAVEPPYQFVVWECVRRAT